MKITRNSSRLSRFSLTGGTFAALALLGAAALPLVAQAQTQVLDFTGGGPGSSGFSGTFGWRFSLSTTATLTNLGIFDRGNNGLFNSHQVGLWRLSDQALLSSTTIAATNTPVVAGDLNGVISNSGFGSFRYNPVTQISLAPGSYVIGAAYIADDDDGFFTADSTVMAPNFTFIGASLRSSGFRFPNPAGTSISYFGPNLRVSSASSTAVTPELPGLALVVPALLPVALVLVRRRRK